MTTPIRATIIPYDTFCSVDGVGYAGVNVTSTLPEVHAMQWYSSYGEEEVMDTLTGKIISNRKIANLDSYQDVFSSYWAIRTAHEAVQQNLIDEQKITEV